MQDAASDGTAVKYSTLASDKLAPGLGKSDAGFFCQWYGIAPAGNSKGKSVLNLPGQTEFERKSKRMAALRERVYAYWLEHTSLTWNDKVLTVWNGLMQAALVWSELALDEPKYLNAVRRTSGSLDARPTAPDGQLPARWRELCGTPPPGKPFLQHFRTVKTASKYLR